MAQHLLIFRSAEAQSYPPSMKTYKIQVCGTSEELEERIMPQRDPSENMKFPDLTQTVACCAGKVMETSPKTMSSFEPKML